MCGLAQHTRRLYSEAQVSMGRMLTRHLRIRRRAKDHKQRTRARAEWSRARS